MTRSSQARARRRRAWRAAAANGAGGASSTTRSEPVEVPTADSSAPDAPAPETRPADAPTVDAPAPDTQVVDDAAAEGAGPDGANGADADRAGADRAGANGTTTAPDTSSTEAAVAATGSAEAEPPSSDGPTPEDSLDEVAADITDSADVSDRDPDVDDGADTGSAAEAATDAADGEAAQTMTTAGAVAAAAAARAADDDADVDEAARNQDAAKGEAADDVAAGVTAEVEAAEAGATTLEPSSNGATARSDADAEADVAAADGEIAETAEPVADERVGGKEEDLASESAVVAAALATGTETDNETAGNAEPETDTEPETETKAETAKAETAKAETVEADSEAETAKAETGATEAAETESAEAQAAATKTAETEASAAATVATEDGDADGQPTDEAAVAATPVRAGTRRRWGVALVLNRIGRGLIAAGVVILLFVGYQLWGTNIQEHRSQDKLESAFNDKLAQLETADPGVLDALRGTGSSTTAAAGAPPTTPTTIPREVFDLIAPQAGEPVAVIRIPSIGVERRVVEGTDVDDLREGPGHYAESPLPGQAGNAAIAGHRTTYGAPFNRIDELVPGDEIQVQTVQGTAVYKVDQAPFVVSPDQVEVLNDYGDNRLTLTSCHPKLSSSKRMIVTAELEGTPFPPLPSDATPVAADVASTTTIPDAVENPGATTTPTEPSPTVTTPGGGSATTLETEPGPPVTTTVPGTASTAPAASGSANEGDNATLGGTSGQANLDQGLAGDRSALPSAIGWGLVTLALVVLAWLAAVAFERRVHVPRRGRRLIVYALASPVVLVFLFLCFENVDRLLPAY